MTSDDNDLPNSAELPRNPFQFSLRTLLIGVTAVAVLCSLLVSSPPWVRALTTLFLAIAVPAALTTIIVYGRGYLRTFAIGAMFPAGVPLATFEVFRFAWSGGSRLFDSPYAGFELSIVVAGALAFIIAIGFVAIGVRWLCEQAQRTPNTDRPDSAAE